MTDKDQPVSEIDLKSLRSCFGRFATGVTVVTYDAGGELRGATVNSFTSVSLDPPLVLVSIARTAKACELLRGTPFSVNVLSSSQISTAMAFAGRPGGAGPEWITTGLAPRFLTSHAWFECSPWGAFEAGDHVLFVGKVEAFAFDETEPLLFYSGLFHARGDDLDEVGRSRRLVARRAAPMSAAALAALADGSVPAWA